ncbi:MAG TPA: GNAT family N-acetyltransferase [Gaiellaceae bacterium]|nr:GNAT family N-acetyltransferase [Gaiellaceae bacterium]
MRRELSGGYELDDDPARVDVDAVHDYLAKHSYWAEGRPRETVERLVREAARVVGVYKRAEGQDESSPSGSNWFQVGFARAVSDAVAVTYLADVYVLPEHQGRDLGVELVREMVENGPLADRRWLLHTRDAHDLYRRFGFGPPGERLMERPPA